MPLKAFKSLEIRERSQSPFSSILPPDVNFKRFQGRSGETVYVFSHSTLGFLGQLSIVPNLSNTQLIWEPMGEYLELYINNLIEEISSILKAPLESHLIPCSHCGAPIAQLLCFPTIQDLETLKASAKHHAQLFLSLPIWITGQGVALEVLWPGRKVFRAVSFDELAASLLAFKAMHCSSMMRDSTLH